MIWKTRCFIAWSFRIAAVIISFLFFLFMLFLGTTPLVKDCGVMTSREWIVYFLICNISTIGLFLFIELFGRLLSWTKPSLKLPRFDL